MKKYAFILMFGLMLGSAFSPLTTQAFGIKSTIGGNIETKLHLADVKTNVRASVEKQKKEDREEKKENKKDSEVKLVGLERALSNHENKVAPKNSKKDWQAFLTWFRAFVIRKEMDRQTNATTTDTTAPKVQEVNVKVATSTANIKWETNETAKTSFYYGTTEPITASSTVITNATFSKDHSVALSSLVPDTKYFYAISVTDASGNTRQTETRTFRTKTVKTDNVTPRISATFTFQTTASSTRLVWFTNELTLSSVWIGTTTPVATTTPPVYTSGTLSYFHETTLTNLASSTTYFYSVKSTDSAGNSVMSLNISFSTSAQ